MNDDEPSFRIDGGDFAVVLVPGRPFARLEDAAGRLWADLALCWSLDSAEGLDGTHWLGEPQLEHLTDRVRVTVEMASSRWAGKRLVMECFPGRLALRTEVEGEGRLTDVHLLAGHQSVSGQGSGFLRSGAGFGAVWNPEPTRWERRPLPAATGSVIDVLGASVPGLEHWFMTPGPFCFAMARELDGPWLGAGLAPEPGECLFTGFHYQGIDDAFGFYLAYEGQVRVSGTWATPCLVLTLSSEDPYAALERHTTLAPKPPLHHGPQPAWWGRPIFCGWGAQCHSAGVKGGIPQDHARADDYDGFLAALENQGLEPGTIVIDDKWQSTYGANEVDVAKWPDLRGWVSRQHRAGRKVLLWWKAWDPEGLPPEECITDPSGRLIAADPTQPAYEARLRAAVRQLLGDDGVGADGFKVDFTARGPSGPGLARRGSEWGGELLHRLLAVLYSEAKRVKPDALVITHAFNPRFRDVTDMVRLNDINLEQPVVPQMRHRARVAGIAMPHALIDTDNWPMRDVATWREYAAVQGDLGVPALYYATHIDRSGEPLAEADYARLRLAWTASAEMGRRPPTLPGS